MLPEGITPFPNPPGWVRQPAGLLGYARPVETPQNSESGSERLSVGAAASFLLALASVAGCLGIGAVAYSQPGRLVYIAAAPAMGLAAVVLGVTSRRCVVRSGGRLRGRGLATMGLFVGLLASIIPTAFILSALVTLSSLRTLAPVAERMVLASAAGRADASRGEMSADARAEVTDARLSALSGVIERSAGAPREADVSVGAVFEARSRVQRAAGAGTGVSPETLGELSPKPVVIRCDRGTVIAYVVLDDAALRDGRVLIDDALFLLPDGGCITLRADGPAVRVARALGVEPTPIEN